MNVLVTGAGGFIGKNLICHLEQLGDENIGILGYDVDSSLEDFARFTSEADFVIHLAGINRPKEASEFDGGNRGFTEVLLNALEAGKKPPVILSSSIQAALSNPYGTSKLGAEEAVIEYGKRTGTKNYIFRLPNVFGKWSRPNYNSAVATFCHNIARGLAIHVNDQDAPLNLVYVDDVCRCFVDALKGKAEIDTEGFAFVEPVHRTTVGHVAELIQGFAKRRETLYIPDSSDELEKKLYSTYLSFIPVESLSIRLKTHTDARGSFTELLKSNDRGQVSVNIIKPGITKGNHWHHTKNEKFIVVSGSALIRIRKVGEDKVHEIKVSGAIMEIIDIPVGYTHSISNIGEEDLITIMWANECFDSRNPDTFFLEV